MGLRRSAVTLALASNAGAQSVSEAPFIRITNGPVVTPANQWMAPNRPSLPEAVASLTITIANGMAGLTHSPTDPDARMFFRATPG